VHLALERILGGGPMTLKEQLDMEGTGSGGDLGEMRSNRLSGSADTSARIEYLNATGSYPAGSVRPATSDRESVVVDPVTSSLRNAKHLDLRTPSSPAGLAHVDDDSIGPSNGPRGSRRALPAGGCHSP